MKEETTIYRLGFFWRRAYRNGTERSGGSGNDSDGAAGYCADGH